MPKKSAPRSSISPASSSKNGDVMLGDIHKKIYSSSALNGGFDTLLFKIDKIEQGQNSLNSKVDKIHDAIHDPSDGLFYKLSEFKIESTQKFSDVENKITSISEWKKHREKTEEKNEEVHDDAAQKLASMEKSVDSLMKSKHFTWAFIKWLLVALGGAAITLFFKWLESKMHIL